MTGQLSLLDDLDRPRVRYSDPATSHAAANTIAQHLGDQQARVLGAMTVLKHATDEELADHLPTMNRGSVVKRRGELTAAGLIQAAGHTRLTRSNCAATVWEITVDGVRLARTLAGAA